MLQEGNYDILEFGMPSQGMNQNIAPDSLPLSFAYILENIIARPLGEGQVRFGMGDITVLPNPEAVILRKFPFVETDGSEQMLFYAQEYTADNANTFQILGALQFSFVSPNNAARYIQDTAIKVEYTFNGQMILYDSIASVTVAGTTVTVTLAQNAFPEPFDQVQITRVSFSTGTLYSYDLSTGTLSAALRQNLSVGCVPRYTTFLNTLVMCNGVDPVLSWDGAALSEVYDFVKEQTQNLARLDDTHLSFTPDDTFTIADYAVGNLLQIKVNGVTTQTTLTNAVEGNNLVTLTVQDVLPPFVQNQTQLFYQAWPPRFNFLFVAHDRLWALGEGAVGIEYRDPQEALKVYYPYKTNTVTGWFNEKTKTVPSIDLSKKHGEPDNLEAICLVGSLMAFVGRKKTQVYQGQNPLPFNEGGDFIFNSILPTGVIHGDLLIDLPNDTFFITPNGRQSFSTLNIAKQFAATSFDALDPLIQQYVASIMISNVTYRSCTSFKYDGGALAGFKIGQNKVLVSLFSTDLYSWSLFSGDFERAKSFLTLGSCLYLSSGNKVSKYADGKDGTPPLYGDQNGEGLIAFAWVLPVIAVQGQRFAGKRYELQMDYPSSFTIRPENQMSLGISGDLPKSYQITSPCRFDLRGDLLQTIPLTSDNPATQDSLGFRLDQPYGFFKDRMKFIASRFWLTLKGMTKDGTLTLRKIKLYGIVERK
jgi:hypothetical protein